MFAWFFRFLLVASLATVIYFFMFYHAPDNSFPQFSQALTNNLLAISLKKAEKDQGPNIRILVAEALDHATLRIKGKVGIEVINMALKKKSAEITENTIIDLAPTGKGIRIGSDPYIRAKIISLDGRPLRLSWVDNKTEVNIDIPYEIEVYGTHVELEKDKRKLAKIRIIATMPIEEYLYGVIAAEMPSSWPLEALKSQAVASRTFALFEIKSRKKAEFDVHLSDKSQVWSGTTVVEPQVRRAVDSTKGIVLTENNALIKTFFHSECGGFTADVRWVFSKTPVLALSGVRCPRCSNKNIKPNTSWDVTYTRQEIMTKLKKAGLVKGGEIRSIQALDYQGNPLGKKLTRAVIIEIVLFGGSGTKIKIPANDFRMAMGADKKNIASTYMVVEKSDENKIRFYGRGWGHGVGMCQYGAGYLARDLQYNYLDILALYYPGSKPVKLW